MKTIFIVQSQVVGGQGKNSVAIGSWAFRRKGDAKQHWIDALVVNGEVDADLAVSLTKEWEEDDALEWSMGGPRGTTIIYRLEAVEVE